MQIGKPFIGDELMIIIDDVNNDVHVITIVVMQRTDGDYNLKLETNINVESTIKILKDVLATEELSLNNDE